MATHITATTKARFMAEGREAYDKGISLDAFQINPAFAALFSDEAVQEMKNAHAQGYYDAASEKVQKASGS